MKQHVLLDTILATDSGKATEKNNRREEHQLIIATDLAKPLKKADKLSVMDSGRIMEIGQFTKSS